MALFAVNIGCRDQEVCQLRWDWEIKIPVKYQATPNESKYRQIVQQLIQRA